MSDTLECADVSPLAVTKTSAGESDKADPEVLKKAVAAMDDDDEMKEKDPEAEAATIEEDDKAVDAEVEAAAAAATPPPGSTEALAGSVACGAGGGALSPLSGAYLLIVLGEPISEEHKEKMMLKLRQGKLIIDCDLDISVLNSFHLFFFSARQK
jgi:hypothetical protein